MDCESYGMCFGRSSGIVGDASGGMQVDLVNEPNFDRMLFRLPAFTYARGWTVSSEETKTPGVQGSQDLQYLDVDLRNPWVAGICAWLFPGAGHFYQRRYMKGCIFMICVLSLYLGGLVMGGGHVVYASWKPQAKRWQYLFQLGVGIPAFPALVQAQRARADEFLDEVRAADFNPPDNR